MTQEQFLSLADLSYLEWKSAPDGVIAHILPEADIDIEKIRQHVAEIGDDTLIVRVAEDRGFDYFYAAKRFKAIRKVIIDSEYDDDRQVIRHELEDLLEDTIGNINDFYQSAYISGTVVMRDGIHTVEEHGFNRFVSDVCDAAYSCTPRINHELINRHVVTGQIARARGVILKGMLSTADFTAYENGSSAEATIYRAVMLHTKTDENLEAVRGEISDFIHSSVGAKTSFSTIVNRLMSPPYGMRKGVLPFYLLEEILLLEDMPVISLNDKEVTLSESAVVSAVARPEAYYLYVEKETAQKSVYIAELENLFDDFRIYCADIDKKNKLAHLACLMQAWYRSLPQSALVFREQDYDGQMIEQIAAFRNELAAAYINPRELLFDRIPAIFDGMELSGIAGEIKAIRKDLDAHNHRMKQLAASVIHRTFGFSDTQDLQQSLLYWYERLPEEVINSVLGAEAEALLQFAGTLETSDEEEIAGRMVSIITGGYIEDWKDGTLRTFEEQLNFVIKEIYDAQDKAGAVRSVVIENVDGGRDILFYDFDIDSISSTGTFFRNSLDGMIEEFDGILDNKEKIGILIDAINRLSGSEGT